MNANELADELNRLQKIYPLTIPFVLNDSATMLRQQQTEIEALKMEIHSLTYGEKLAEYLKKAQEK